jgi:hypothetical protein
MRVQVCRGGKLALREPITSIVLNQIDSLNISSAGVLELAESDVRGITIAADPNTGQMAIRHQRSGCHGGHPAVERVKPMAVLKEVCRGFTRTTDPTDFDRIIGIQPYGLAGLNQRACDAVVTTSLAEGRREPLKGQGWQ